MLRLSLGTVALCLAGWSASAADVETSPLPVKPVLAFPELKFDKWEPDVNGKPSPLRPILLTHAGDGSNRLFVPQQQGQVHVFTNKGEAQTTKIFLDISSKVLYKDNENEQGLLGLAFHPKYKQNGEFFIYYSTKEPLLTTVISRFKVSKDDPNKADPASEQEIFRLTHPFWNHKGGTICFGPDGFLYVAIGDGGAGNDPFNNAQNLQTPLGKILRIDVDKKDSGLAYGIPKDNPYVNVIAAGGKQPIARPEVWAYGLRNVWRMAFDRQTGDLWAADVGQNVWEEINIIEKGGNYGWNLRESKHVFTPNGNGTNSSLIDPIWEYHHDIGKSITGGHVYRGKKVSQLAGYYLYGDYVSAKLWALKYDPKTKTVTENRSIAYEGTPLQVISYGEDEEGEVYLTIVSPTGQGIYKFVAK
ncbi:MAG TPA: PQQ-dependent sugar dehydrogenase [Planctomycetaceae bacterium]|nr:PQQ-dependent sugar dehydrogenase [Planctomycetaceae bacterium]